MKKLSLFIIILNLITSVLFAKTVKIEFTHLNGEVTFEEVDSKTKLWSVINGYNKPRITNVKGIEKLKNLESLEFINIMDIDDYSFLACMKNLKHLHFSGCTFKTADLCFLENMVSLETLYLDVGLSENAAKREIDLSKLNKLKFIRFNDFKTKNIPRFVNVKTKPFIELHNMDIKTVSDEEVLLLKQYSEVSLFANPICNDELAKKKLEELNVRFNIEDELSNWVMEYYKAGY